VKNLLILLVLSGLFFACTPPEVDAEKSTAEVTSTSEQPFANRISAAEARLRTSEAGQLILASINAHGGLKKWYNQSPLYYHFNYRPVGDATVRDSYILNDYVNARAVHQSADQKGISYGFDGKNAWQSPADSTPTVSPRFWSLTPYYFVGLPFVLADEGILFDQLEDETLDGVDYQRVKITYAEGTGDADDDYYILYLNPETKQVDALNYIVSYPGFFENGKHLPEKLMRITDKKAVDGIILPTGYGTYWSNKPEEVITRITVSDHEFRPETKGEAFAVPLDAKLVNDLAAKQ
jgi:hypothetical protein